MGCHFLLQVAISFLLPGPRIKPMSPALVADSLPPTHQENLWNSSIYLSRKKKITYKWAPAVQTSVHEANVTTDNSRQNVLSSPGVSSYSSLVRKIAFGQNVVREIERMSRISGGKSCMKPFPKELSLRSVKVQGNLGWIIGWKMECFLWDQSRMLIPGAGMWTLFNNIVEEGSKIIREGREHLLWSLIKLTQVHDNEDFYSDIGSESEKGGINLNNSLGVRNEVGGNSSGSLSWVQFIKTVVILAQKISQNKEVIS